MVRCACVIGPQAPVRDRRSSGCAAVEDLRDMLDQFMSDMDETRRQVKVMHDRQVRGELRKSLGHARLAR